MIAVIETPVHTASIENSEYARACLKDSYARGEIPALPRQMMFDLGIDDMYAFARAYESAEVVAVYADMGITSAMRSGMNRAKDMGLTVEMRYLYRPDPQLMLEFAA